MIYCDRGGFKMIIEGNILELSVHQGRENFDMKFDLHEVFFGKEKKTITNDFPVIKYTRWGRVKKIIKLVKKYSYCNEKSVENFTKWLKSQILISEYFRDSNTYGGDKYKMYQKEVYFLNKALNELSK